MAQPRWTARTRPGSARPDQMLLQYVHGMIVSHKKLSVMIIETITLTA